MRQVWSQPQGCGDASHTYGQREGEQDPIAAAERTAAGHRVGHDPRAGVLADQWRGVADRDGVGPAGVRASANRGLEQPPHLVHVVAVQRVLGLLDQ